MPRQWLEETRTSLPRFLTAPLEFAGNPVADVTDALGWTGHDAVYEYDTEAPAGQALFAGAPARIGAPAPSDIRIIDRGEFVFGWSDRLRHPVWCAYHVVKDARYAIDKRPGFVKDKAIPAAPSPSDYTKSGYDRGHLAPNHAIATRYGEIWVVVGCISPSANGETIGGTNIDVPQSFYQVIVAQEGMDVRALALVFPQQVPWNAWAARHIVTIEELEKMTGLDFNPDLPGFIQRPLESDLPTRLWPIRARDIFKLVGFWFK